jgi:hypothetical protein
MLTDFGIALAVREAGGDRLTESGLSLGTPSYMSPEQATGDRALDARSDVYSLAAVLYEMLAGEPPHTGATVQAVIARLMTERPTRLRTIRDTVPEGVDAAVAKALAKVPADRFSGAREFAAVLTAAPAGPPPRVRRRVLLWSSGAVAGLVVAALIAFGMSHWREPAVGMPVKLTSSGDITAAALSPDGTRLAKSVRECDSRGRCTYALVWQDLGGAGELRISDRLGSIRSIEWSPDGRQLVFAGTDSAGRYGAFRLGSLGGTLQFLGCCNGHFLTTADTILLVRSDPAGESSLSVLTPADGVVHDSTKLGGRRSGLYGSPSPTGKLVVGLTVVADSVRLMSLDRRWATLDMVVFPNTYQGPPVWDPRGDAVYLKRVAAGGGTSARLERIPVSSRGKFGSPQAITGLSASDLEGFSIVGNSRILLYLEGGEERTVHALTRANAGSVEFKPHLLRRSTGELGATLSPDGRFICVFSRPAESSPMQIAIIPFEGGPEIPVPRRGSDVIEMAWTRNSSRLLYSARDSGNSATLYSFDPASARVREIGPFMHRAGWEAVRDNLLAWVDDSAGAVVLADTTGRELRRLPDPDRSERTGTVSGSPDGRHLFTSRWNAGFDSLRFTKISLADGHRQPLGSLRMEEPAGSFWAPDGSIQLAVLETIGTLAVYRLDQRGGPPVRLGSFSAEGAVYFTFSKDGRRAVKVESRPRGDVWIMRNFDGRGSAE